jgi:hypothetical protein
VASSNFSRSHIGNQTYRNLTKDNEISMNLYSQMPASKILNQGLTKQSTASQSRKLQGIPHTQVPNLLQDTPKLSSSRSNKPYPLKI